jgi:hypothetical protein
MKKLSIVLAALLGAALVTSAVAIAKPKPGPGPKEAAAQECEALADADAEAFDAAYGRSAAQACLESQRPEAAGVIRDAAAECREERGNSSRSQDAFKQEHRSGKGANDAFGNCVSSLIKADRRDERSEFKNAAKECRAERGDTPESWAAFEEKYGTNKDDPLWMYKPGGNAFGKCVSSKVGNRRSD